MAVDIAGDGNAAVSKQVGGGFDMHAGLQPRHRSAVPQRVDPDVFRLRRHEARAKAKAESIDIECDRPGLADGVSYSLGDPEASRVMKQMRLDADDARRAHGADRGKST